MSEEGEDYAEGRTDEQQRACFVVAAQADEADPHRPASRHEVSDVPAYRFPQFIFPVAILPPGRGLVSGPSLPCIGG